METHRDETRFKLQHFRTSMDICPAKRPELLIAEFGFHFRYLWAYKGTPQMPRQ
uniref:Uncharacterized protein n=1 Tax=Magallana gigas TaxID=29159 RepID=K1S019_MAGGI